MCVEVHTDRLAMNLKHNKPVIDTKPTHFSRFLFGKTPPPAFTNSIIKKLMPKAEKLLV